MAKSPSKSEELKNDEKFEKEFDDSLAKELEAKPKTEVPAGGQQPGDVIPSEVRNIPEKPVEVTPSKPMGEIPAGSSTPGVLPPSVQGTQQEKVFKEQSAARQRHEERLKVAQSSKEK